MRGHCTNPKENFRLRMNDLRNNPIEMSNQKFRLRKDDDGHSYLIPNDKSLLELFETLVEDEDGWADDRWQQFEDMRIDNFSRFTFENPTEETE